MDSYQTCHCTICSWKKQNRAISHIHYVGLSRATTIEALQITDLCENKIALNPDVKAEMQCLPTEGHFKVSVTPIYETSQTVSLIQGHCIDMLEMYART